MVTNPKKFFQKMFSRFKKNFSNIADNGENNFKMETQIMIRLKEKDTRCIKKEEGKKEKQLVRDSGFDCKYCNGKKHFIKECILRK